MKDTDMRHKGTCYDVPVETYLRFSFLFFLLFVTHVVGNKYIDYIELLLYIKLNSSSIVFQTFMDSFSSLNLLFYLLAQHVNMICLTCFFSSSNQVHKLWEVSETRVVGNKYTAYCSLRLRSYSYHADNIHVNTDQSLFVIPACLSCVIISLNCYIIRISLYTLSNIPAKFRSDISTLSAFIEI